LSQLSLLQHLNDNFSEENFVFLKENLAAENFLKSFFDQKNFGKSKLQSLIIKGESHCGKSHLLHIFAQKFEVHFLDKAKISDTDLSNFFAENGFYILEDFDDLLAEASAKAGIKNEELVLRLINLAFESKAFLVLTAKNNHKFHLKDLVSRLKNIPLAEIKNPSLESVKQLLANGFSRRQIKLSSKMIDFLATHIARSYEAVFSAVKKVENFCNENGKDITAKDLELMFG